MRELHALSLEPVELSGSLRMKINMAAIVQQGGNRIPWIYYLFF